MEDPAALHQFTHYGVNHFFARDHYYYNSCYEIAALSSESPVNRPACTYQQLLAMASKHGLDDDDDGFRPPWPKS